MSALEFLDTRISALCEELRRLDRAQRNAPEADARTMERLADSFSLALLVALETKRTVARAA